MGRWQGDSSIKLLLIPGMDGTGKLFSSLFDVLPENIDTQVVCLNTLNNQEPKEQALKISLFVLVMTYFDKTHYSDQYQLVTL